MRSVSKFEVPQLSFELCELCAETADRMGEEHGIETSAPPLAGLNMAHLGLVQCLELLDFYYHLWDQMPGTGDDKEDKRILEENIQRVALVQKSTFIHTMSCFEAAAKVATKETWSPINIPGRRVYLGGIMKISHDHKLISDADSLLWRFAVELRNCIVHNNALSEVSTTYDLGGGLVMEMVAGRMTQSTPRKATVFLREIVLAYSRWCDGMLTAKG